jgi:hypothetical protein
MNLQSFFDLLLRGSKIRYTFWQRFHLEQHQRPTSEVKPIRHYGPFNKTQRGAERRAARRFKLQQRDATER